MKRVLFLAVTLVLAIGATAQNDSLRLTLKEQLARPAQIDSVTVNNNTIHLFEQGDAQAIVEQNLHENPSSINGYRIVIFMSNAQSARRDAVVAQENFTQLFPTERAYLTYDNPYFKIAVGNYSSQEEAIILLGRIRQAFPKAFLTREDISVGEFSK